jgi:hypothetical protein
MTTSQSTKACRYCGEEILAVAVRCKHCQADLGGPGGARAVAAGGRAGEALGTLQLLLPFGAAILIWLWVGSMNLLQDPASTLMVITVVTILATGAIAAVEASQLGIGADTDRDTKGRKRSGPGLWFVFHLVLWILAFPSYLYWRSKYGAKNMVVGGILVALLFTASSLGMGVAIESQKAEIRERIQQAW